MKYVAFYRNLNLGRANCPDRIGFEQAFIAAGATSAASFLTNGSMVFSADSADASRRVFAGACVNLNDACGLKEAGYIRALDYLVDLVALDPFDGMEEPNVHEYCVSFLPPACGPIALPLASKRGDVQLLRRTESEVLSLSVKIGNTPGSPNALLEKMLGVPVTTRSWNTVVRLVRKHA